MTDTARTAPLDRAWLRARTLSLIDEAEAPEGDDNLIAFGLDSVGVMSLVATLKERGVDVGFEDLARDPTLDAWWRLIEARRAP